SNAVRLIAICCRAVKRKRERCQAPRNYCRHACLPSLPGPFISCSAASLYMGARTSQAAVCHKSARGETDFCCAGSTGLWQSPLDRPRQNTIGSGQNPDHDLLLRSDVAALIAPLDADDGIAGLKLGSHRHLEAELRVQPTRILVLGAADVAVIA